MSSRWIRLCRLLWQRFGKPFVGYTVEDYQNVVEEIAGEKLEWYWKECIFTNEPLGNQFKRSTCFCGITNDNFQ